MLVTANVFFEIAAPGQCHKSDVIRRLPRSSIQWPQKPHSFCSRDGRKTGRYPGSAHVIQTYEGVSDLARLQGAKQDSATSIRQSCASRQTPAVKPPQPSNQGYASLGRNVPTTIRLGSWAIQYFSVANKAPGCASTSPATMAAVRCCQAPASEASFKSHPAWPLLSRGSLPDTPAPE